MAARTVIVLAAAALLTTGCGAAAPGPPRTPTPPPSRTAVRATYPDHAADAALCKAYNADIQSGDTYDIALALQGAAGSVSPKLARDIQAVVNDRGLRQDLRTQINVTMDCALVKAGVAPAG